MCLGVLVVGALVCAWCALQAGVDLENPSYNLAISMRVQRNGKELPACAVNRTEQARRDG